MPTLKEVLGPLISAARHVFMKPYTIKYPYEKVPGMLQENYRYDPKAGIAYPGTKGRHLLRMDKCTGCSLCDIACQNIAEAITMVYAYDVFLDVPEDVFKEYGDPSSPVTGVAAALAEGLAEVAELGEVKYGFSHPVVPVLPDLKTVTKHDGYSSIRLVSGPVWARGIDYLVYNYLEGAFGALQRSGYTVSLVEDQSPDRVVYEVAKDVKAVRIRIEKRNMNIPVNKKSYFPSVDYGRCVFCGFCVDPMTPVIVNPGLKPIAEIGIGDKVLTHTGEYRPVTKIWELSYTGYLYKIEVYGHPDPLICTADHPILAVCRPFSSRKDRRLLRVKEPLGFVLPDQLKRGDYVVLPIPKKVVESPLYTQPVRLYRNGRVEEVLKLPNEPDLYRLIGYYLAEGFCDGDREVNFTFGAYETEVIEDCKALISRYFNKQVKEEKNTGRGIRLALHSVRAFHFFKQFGQGAHNKRIPDWVFFADFSKQVQLVKGLWLGDGCLVNQPRQRYLNITTTSKTLAYQTQLVLARLGVVGVVERQNCAGKKTVYRVNVFGKYALELANKMGIDMVYAPTKFVDKFQITENYVYYPIRSIDRQFVANYKVMDVTVADDHTFVPAGVTTSNCVDACPFYALEMTPDFELSSLSRQGLVYFPTALAAPKFSSPPPSINPIDAIMGWLRRKLL